MENLFIDKLCGAWRLVFWRIEYGGNRPASEPFGPDPDGLIVYDRSGWMSATMSSRRRSPFSGASAASASVESKAKALDEYLAYTGQWWLEGQTIVHRVNCSLNPILIGTEQRRDALISGESLDLTAVESETHAGRIKTRRHNIRWRRLAHAAS